MGLKSEPLGWNLNWGKSKAGKIEKCDLCKKEAHQLQYVSNGKKWICSKCAGRPMLEKPKMFGKIVPLTQKQHDHQHDFVTNTKFGDD